MFHQVTNQENKMSTIIIKSVSYDNFTHEEYRDLTFRPSHELVRKHLPRYKVSKHIIVPQYAEAAAEEAFDLTNNPSRQDEREEKYGNGKSLSVGDVVEVNGVNYLCESFGWAIL